MAQSHSVRQENGKGHKRTQATRTAVPDGAMHMPSSTGELGHPTRRDAWALDLHRFAYAPATPGEGWTRLLLTLVLVVSLVSSTGTVSALFSDTQSVGGNTFSTHPCFQATVNSVQSGTATNNTNGTQTVTINSVNTAKAFL